MENIKKFEEYEMDIEGGDIAEEYAKMIVSKYIDSPEGTTLENVFVDIILKDQLEDQAFIIKNEILVYTSQLFDEAKKIRNILDIQASKYNL